MGLLIVLASAVVIAGLITYAVQRGTWECAIDVAGVSFLTLMFGGIICLGVFFAVDESVERAWVQTDEMRLVSWRMADDSQKELYVGIERRGDEQYYFFYRLTKNENQEPVRVKNTGNILVFDQPSGGAVKVFVKQVVSKTVCGRWAYCGNGPMKYEIFVPAGTVRPNFGTAE